MATELTSLDYAWIEFGATGGTLTKVMEDEILIALFVQMMIASESVGVPFTNVIEAYRTRVQYLSVYECFEKFHVRPDAASFRRAPFCECAASQGYR